MTACGRCLERHIAPEKQVRIAGTKSVAALTYCLFPWS